MGYLWELYRAEFYVDILLYVCLEFKGKVKRKTSYNFGNERTLQSSQGELEMSKIENDYSRYLKFRNIREIKSIIEEVSFGEWFLDTGSWNHRFLSDFLQMIENKQY